MIASQEAQWKICTICINDCTHAEKMANAGKESPQQRPDVDSQLDEMTNAMNQLNTNIGKKNTITEALRVLVNDLQKKIEVQDIVIEDLRVKSEMQDKAIKDLHQRLQNEKDNRKEDIEALRQV
jgi:SMC interacting uncharacterized protein involved in chromosome segregation